MLSCQQGASKLRERMKPSEEPTEVPESVQKGVIVADQVTGNVLDYTVYSMKIFECHSSSSLMHAAKLLIKLASFLGNIL